MRSLTYNMNFVFPSIDGYLESVENNDVYSNSIPVSYTHLDVYKRQVYI